ncbi:LppX_LprAFG lipoprotein [Streptomyces melanogenes]|uniref:LppX_LprAFG lipoprotein n=1 Tax=Streptomyces melanogenes TaxID=67326 RepID=UPI00379F0890
MRRTLVLTAAAALLCAACTRTNDPDAAVAVREAVAAARQTSAHISTTLDLTAGVGKTYTIATSGGFDLAADRGRLDVRLVQGSNRAEEIIADGKAYLRNVEPQEVEHAWGVADQKSAQAHYLFRAPLNDPQHTLRQVADMTRVQDKGTETVNGATTTRYQGVLDHNTLVLRMAKKAREEVDAMRGEYGRDLPVTAEAWVDAQGRLVQARLSLKDATATVAVLTMSLSDLGKPVRVSAPTGAAPASDTPNILAG